MLRTGKVLSLRKKGSKSFLLKNRALLLMCLVFLIGIIIAVISAKNKSFDFGRVFDFFYLRRQQKKFFKVFLISFSVYFSTVTLLFLAGSSLMGGVMIPFVLFLLGFFCGGLSSYLYAQYSLKGIAFNSVVLLPPTIVFLIICMFAAKTSFYFSLNIVKLTLIKGNSVNMSDSFKNFCSRFSVFAVLTVAASLFDSILSSLLIKVFNF